MAKNIKYCFKNLLEGAEKLFLERNFQVSCEKMRKKKACLAQSLLTSNEFGVAEIWKLQQEIFNQQV